MQPDILERIALEPPPESAGDAAEEGGNGRSRVGFGHCPDTGGSQFWIIIIITYYFRNAEEIGRKKKKTGRIDYESV